MQPQGAALYSLLIQLAHSVVSYGVKSNVRQKKIIVAITRGHHHCVAARMWTT
ncbi:hypothetical protein HanIR_Chr10g0476671 [Helianthus annuus]|nr:hypothetical protein HanIR_Chr10g0476671 [Helianthus annuus]